MSIFIEKRQNISKKIIAIIIIIIINVIIIKMNVNILIQCRFPHCFWINIHVTRDNGENFHF